MNETKNKRTRAWPSLAEMSSTTMLDWTPEQLARLGMVSLLLGALSVPVSANDVTVRVSKRGTSDFVQAAAVCLGTLADHAQFGTVHTGPNGDVTFSQVPTSTSLVLTVSKQGFRGRRIVIVPARASQTVLLTLSAGGGGPACNRPVEVAAPVASNLLAVRSFRINGGASRTADPTVTLSYAVTGSPTHYRVAEDRTFASTGWVPFRGETRYRLSPGSGVKTVYLQLRRVHSQSGATIEGVSEVASSRIRLGEL